VANLSYLILVKGTITAKFLLVMLGQTELILAKKGNTCNPKSIGGKTIEQALAELS